MLIYLTLLRFHTLKKKRKTKHSLFLKAQSGSLIFRELLCSCFLSCSSSTVGCTSGRTDPWNPQRWESLQVSFFRRQIAAFGCYIFPPQTSPWWAQQINSTTSYGAAHVTIFSAEDSKANVWHMSGFLTTETISPSSGLRGEAEAGEFLTLPSTPLHRLPLEIAEKEENKPEQKPQEQLVCGLPCQQVTAKFWGLDPWDSAVLQSAEIPSPSESTVWIYLLVSIFPLMPFPQGTVMQCRRHHWDLTGATESS